MEGKNVVTLRDAAYSLLQCTWGILQTLLGLALFLRFRRRQHHIFHGGIATKWGRGGGVSLGQFFFYDENREDLLLHEYGHTLQSLILGPLYLLVVGIPSFLWANLPYFKERRKRKGIPYSGLYCERWADALGRH